MTDNYGRGGAHAVRLARQAMVGYVAITPAAVAGEREGGPIFHRGAMHVTKRLRSDQGFSLIELLIVTVILGIMAEAVHYGFRLFAKFEASV